MRKRPQFGGDGPFGRADEENGPGKRGHEPEFARPKEPASFGTLRHGENVVLEQRTHQRVLRHVVLPLAPLEPEVLRERASRGRPRAAALKNEPGSGTASFENLLRAQQRLVVMGTAKVAGIEAGKARARAGARARSQRSEVRSQRNARAIAF